MVKSRRKKKHRQLKKRKSSLKVKEMAKKKNKKHRQRTINVGVRKKRIAVLWILLIFTSLFGIYRNFSAIDTHTVYVKTTVDSRIQSTTNIENFVIRFAQVFFSNETGISSSDRNELLGLYLTDELIRVNGGRFFEKSNNVIVRNVFVWDIKQQDENNLEVLFSVIQNVSGTDGENDVDVEIETAYSVNVHIDYDANMVITRKILAQMPIRSAYVRERLQSDSSVDFEKRSEVLEFLELFFNVYPTASEAELAFYVRNDAMPLVERDLIFSSLRNVVINVDEQVLVEVEVEYLCRLTITNIVVDYLLVLERQNDNFMIKSRQ